MTALSNAELSAINCIPGAMYAAATVTISATAALRKPRKPIRETQSPKRNWYPEDVKPCRENYIAVMMLGDLRYWLEPDEETGESRAKIPHDGHTWVARSITNWKTKLGCTSDKKIRVAIDILKNEGLVITDMFWFAGADTTHYRLSPKALQSIPTRVYGKPSKVPKKEAGGATGGIGGATGGTTITGITSGSEILKTKILKTGENETPSPENHVQATPENETGKKSQNQNLSPCETVKEISPECECVSLESKDENELLWTDTMRRFKRPVLNHLSDVQRSKLNRIRYQIETEMHTPFRDVLHVLIGQWGRFTDLFEDTPSTQGPSIGWLLSNLTSFTSIFSIDESEVELVTEKFLRAREWWLTYLSSDKNLRTWFERDLSRAVVGTI